MYHHRHRPRQRHERHVDRPVRERDVQELAAPAPPAGPIRVADADRERVADLLRGHAAAGRIDTSELEERLERTYAARYGSELEAVLAELPAEPAPRTRGSRPRRAGAPLFLVAVGALIALAVVTGAWWLMWLIWPIAIVLGPRPHHRHARYH